MGCWGCLGLCSVQCGSKRSGMRLSSAHSRRGQSCRTELDWGGATPASDFRVASPRAGQAHQTGRSFLPAPLQTKHRALIQLVGTHLRGHGLLDCWCTSWGQPSMLQAPWGLTPYACNLTALKASGSPDFLRSYLWVTFSVFTPIPLPCLASPRRTAGGPRVDQDWLPTPKETAPSTQP